MDEIKVNPELVRTWATSMSKNHARMQSSYVKTSIAIERIQQATEWKDTSRLVFYKMNALKKLTKDLFDQTEKDFGILMKVAATFEEAQNSIKNALPDWAKQMKNGNYASYYTETIGKSNERLSGTVSERNLDGNMSCTYYTLRKLHERGIGFPFIKTSKVAGGEWFDNCSAIVPKYAGTDCLKRIADDYCTNGKILSNIVIDKPGHVLLIDRLYKNEQGVTMVEWSDMAPLSIWDNGQQRQEFGRLANLEDKNAPIIRTLDEFMKCYGALNGAVIIGK